MNAEERGRIKAELLEDMRSRPFDYSSDVLKILFDGINMYPHIQEYLINGSQERDVLARFLLSDQTLNYEDLIRNRIIPDTIDLDSLLSMDVPASHESDVDESQKCIDVIFLGLPRSGKSIVSASVMERLQANALANYISSPITDKYYNSLLSCFRKKKFIVGSAADSVRYALYDIPKKTNTRIIDPGDNIIRVFPTPTYINNNNKKILFFIIDSEHILGRSVYFSVFSDFTKNLNNCLNYLCHNGTGEMGSRNCTMSNVYTIVLLFTKFDSVGLSDGEQTNEWMKRQIEEKLFMTYHGLVGICHQYAINRANDYKPIIMCYSVGNVYVGNTFEYIPQDADNLTQFILSQIPPKPLFGN